MADKKTFKPEQIPGLKQAAEAMSGRVYTHPYDDGTQGQFIYKNEQLVPFSGKDIVYKDEKYYDPDYGVYGTQKVGYSTGQNIIDQAMADPLSWVASNANWAGLSQGGDFDALDAQMKFLKDNKYDLSSLPNQGAVNQYKLTKQILDQGTTSKWKGEGYGTPVENAKVIAGMLANTGIKDIKDFGKFNGVVSRTDQLVRPKDPADLSKGYVYDELQNVDYFDQNEYINKSEARPTGRTLDLPEGIPVRQESSFDNEGNPTTTAIASIPKYGETFGNKATKQSFVDSQNYNQARGNIFSGTYIGKDSTGYGVQFAADGTPYFYTQEGNKTSSMGDIMPVVSLGLALFAPGIGTAIGTALGATGVAASVIGSAIVQGTMAELSGGDFKDGAISGAIGAGMAPLVSNTIGSAVADAMGDSAFSKVVNNAVNSAATAGLTAGLTGKGDVLDSALNAAVASVGNTYGRELGGDTGAKIGTALGKIATGADAEQVLTSTIMDTLKSTVTGALKEDGKGKDKSGGGDGDDALIGGAGDDSIDDLIGLTPTEVGDRGAVENVSVGGDDSLDGGVSTDTTGADNTGADTTGADTTGANDVLNGLLSGNGVTNEDDLLGGLGEDTLEGGVSTDTTGADSVAGGAEDPLLGLSSAEAGQDEVDAINNDALLNLSSAEVGQGELDAIDAALNTGAVSTGGAKTTTGGGTTNTTTTNTTTKAADTSSGVDILSLLALMGGEQKPVQQKPEVNDDPFVEFDFNSPFRVNPFAPRSPTPRMAEGGSIDELLELLQYRG